MKRRSAVALGSAAALGVGAGVATGWWRDLGRDERQDASASDTADVWSAPVLAPDGSAFSMAPFRGRPLLANFWASWCVPCVTELPLLDRFHAAQRSRGANGWQVVALAIDTSANVGRFLARTPLALPVGILDAGAYDLPRRLGNTGGGLPFTVLHDAAGRVALRHLGAVDDELLATWVSALN